jgi:hypothetical protein
LSLASDRSSTARQPEPIAAEQQLHSEQEYDRRDQRRYAGNVADEGRQRSDAGQEQQRPERPAAHHLQDIAQTDPLVVSGDFIDAIE